MAGKPATEAPSSLAEGMNGILQAIVLAMTAPDAGPAIPLLTDMQKAILGQMHGGAKPAGAKPGGPPGAPPQGAPPGAAPGGPQGGGGGMNIGQLLGGGGGGHSVGPVGGPSSTGISADDVRRMIASQSGD